MLYRKRYFGFVEPHANRGVVAGSRWEEQDLIDGWEAYEASGEGCCAWPMREGSERRIASLSPCPLSNGVFFVAREAKRWPQTWLLAQAALGYLAGTSPT